MFGQCATYVRIKQEIESLGKQRACKSKELAEVAKELASYGDALMDPCVVDCDGCSYAVYLEETGGSRKLDAEERVLIADAILGKIKSEGVDGITPQDVAFAFEQKVDKEETVKKLRVRKVKA